MLLYATPNTYRWKDALKWTSISFEVRICNRENLQKLINAFFSRSFMIKLVLKGLAWSWLPYMWVFSSPLAANSKVEAENTSVLVHLGVSDVGFCLRGWENRSSGTLPLGPVGCPFHGHYRKGDLNHTYIHGPKLAPLGVSIQHRISFVNQAMEGGFRSLDESIMKPYFRY